eukprot:9921461-Lingulodinium_polyedra.AAC.1
MIPGRRPGQHGNMMQRGRVNRQRGGTRARATWQHEATGAGTIGNVKATVPGNIWQHGCIII